MAAEPKSKATRSQWPHAGPGHIPVDWPTVVRIQCPGSAAGGLCDPGKEAGLCPLGVWTLRLFLPQGPGSWASFTLLSCRICESSRIGPAGASCCCAFRTPGAGGAGRGPGGRGECGRALWVSVCGWWAAIRGPPWPRALLTVRVPAACGLDRGQDSVWSLARPTWHLLCAGPQTALGGWLRAGPRDPSDAERQGLS